MFEKLWGRVRDTFKPARKSTLEDIKYGQATAGNNPVSLPQKVIRQMQIQLAMKAFAGISQQQAYEIVRKRIKKRHIKKAKGRIKL